MSAITASDTALNLNQLKNNSSDTFRSQNFKSPNLLDELFQKAKSVSENYSDTPIVKNDQAFVSSDPLKYSKVGYTNLSTSEEFFFQSSGLPLWQVCEEVSKYYNINIMVFDDVKDKPIFATVSGKSITDTLNCLAWLLGVEYVFKDGIYFFGSNSKTVLVLPSSGIDLKIEQVFPNVTVKQISDKIVILGTERDVTKVKDAYAEIANRNFCVVHLYAIEFRYEANTELGLDIDHIVKYTFTWENLIASQFNPVNALVLSISASLQAKADMIRVSDLIDTDIGVISGKEINLQIGQDVDRPIYTQSNYGEQSQVTSGFSTQHSGLILKIKGYYDSKDWYIDFYAENSIAESDLIKRLTTIDTTSKLSKSQPVQVLARLSGSTSREQFTNGIPFFCDIPGLGYLFRVTDEVEMNHVVYFVLQLKDPSQVDQSIPQPIQVDGIYKLRQTVNSITK